MINGFSKFVVLYMSPMLMLTSLFLSLFAFLAPVAMLSGQVALITVVPSTILTNPQAVAKDGPSLFIGALGSCSRSSNTGLITCMTPSVTPEYNTSVLSGANGADILSSPPSCASAFIAVAIAFSFIFFIFYTLLCFRHKMSAKLSGHLDNPIVSTMAAWMGVIGFVLGMASFLVVAVWFDKAINDFNNSIIKQGKAAPELVAAFSNGFTMIWISYAFYAVPIIASLTKINIQAGEGKEFDDR